MDTGIASSACLAVGHGQRHRAVDLIVLDEAARVDDALLAALRPMLAVSNGSLFALSTPAGKRGWFEQWSRGVGWNRISKVNRVPADLPAFLAEEREQLGPRSSARNTFASSTMRSAAPS